MADNALDIIEELKRELDALRPLSPDIVGRVEQKLRLESNYHSNAIEGNTLTLGETRSLILHGLTARGKPMRDHLDIQGHNAAVKAIEDAVRDNRALNEVVIPNLHRILLKEPYEMDAVTPDGRRTKRTISIGNYKTVPNNVRTSTGEIYYFTPPGQVKPAMGNLIDWYRAKEREGEHPVIIAATFHYRFVRIHPFDDGNGRMARLLMNLILIKHGYSVALIRQQDRARYIDEIERVDKTEDLTRFIDYMASCCQYALNLYLAAARGESIDDPDDIDREIALFRRSLDRGAATGEGLALCEHVDAVVRPLREYCRSKVEALSRDIFASMQAAALTLKGTTTDGAGVFVSFNADGTDIPDGISSATFEFVFFLDRYRLANRSVVIRVQNRLIASECHWSFCRNPGQDDERRYECGGRCLDELKMQFNQLLRDLMAHLSMPSAATRTDE